MCSHFYGSLCSRLVKKFQIILCVKYMYLLFYSLTFVDAESLWMQIRGSPQWILWILNDPEINGEFPLFPKTFSFILYFIFTLFTLIIRSYNPDPILLKEFSGFENDTMWQYHYKFFLKKTLCNQFNNSFLVNSLLIKSDW